MSSSIVNLGVASIETTVTRETSEINSLVKTFLCNESNTKKIIGLDTERAQKWANHTKTVLLQLCDGDHCLIVQLPSGDDVKLPLSLFNFLNLPDFTFVGIGITKTLKMLETQFGLTCKNVVEMGPPKRSLMTYEMDHLKIIKSSIVQNEAASPVLDDWGTSALNENQIMLAVSNAYLSFAMGSNMFDY